MDSIIHPLNNWGQFFLTEQKERIAGRGERVAGEGGGGDNEGPGLYPGTVY